MEETSRGCRTTAAVAEQEDLEVELLAKKPERTNQGSSDSMMERTVVGCGSVEQAARCPHQTLEAAQAKMTRRLERENANSAVATTGGCAVLAGSSPPGEALPVIGVEEPDLR